MQNFSRAGQYLGIGMNRNLNIMIDQNKNIHSLLDVTKKLPGIKKTVFFVHYNNVLYV